MDHSSDLSFTDARHIDGTLGSPQFQTLNNSVDSSVTEESSESVLETAQVINQGTATKSQPASLLTTDTQRAISATDIDTCSVGNEESFSQDTYSGSGPENRIEDADLMTHVHSDYKAELPQQVLSHSNKPQHRNNDIKNTLATPNCANSTDDAVRWTIHRVVGMKRVGRKVFYNVQWENTWESAENFIGGGESAIIEFERLTKRDIHSTPRKCMPGQPTDAITRSIVDTDSITESDTEFEEDLPSPSALITKKAPPEITAEKLGNRTDNPICIPEPEINQSGSKAEQLNEIKDDTSISRKRKTGPDLAPLNTSTKRNRASAK